MSTLQTATITIKGVRAQLRLADGVVTIHKQGDTVTAPSTLEIPVDRIRTTSLEAPRRGGRGWFHVSVIGGTPAPVGEMGAMSDPYALPITVRAVSGCKRLAKLVERHLREHGLPSDATPNDGLFSSGVVVTQPAPAPPPSTRKVAKATGKKATAKKATAKKATAKKATAKKATAKKATAKKATAKKATAKKATAKKATAKAAEEDLGGQELIDQLRQLGELHAAGVLNDDEFAAAKGRILG